MKKVSILSVLLVLCLLLTGCGGPKPEIGHDYDEIYASDSVSVTADREWFSVLKINDTHLFNGRNEADKRTLADIGTMLKNTRCDLIIVAGDMVEGSGIKPGYDKYYAVGQLAKLIEQKNVPWTFAPGNNDGERGGDKRELIAFLMQYPHFLCGNVEGLTGTMQFFIDIEKDGKPVHSIAVIDSLERDSKHKYDYMKEDQIRWLNDGANERAVPVSVFFHMPTPAFKTAYTEGEAYPGFPFCDKYPVDSIEKNSLFDEMLADNKYITLLSCGHVHSDNMAYFYNGRWYQLSSLGGYGATGADDFDPSYTLTVIHFDADSAHEMYDFGKINA